MAEIKFNREQTAIIEHRAGNMIVSASAGSGKTTVMLERVLRIIEEGTPIDSIVILAFNNSIAAEIRGKMYKKLTQALQKDCANAEFIKQQIDKLPFCNIITNDSYCNRTSAEFFQILGIDPSAEITSEVQKKIMFSKAFKLALSDLKEKNDKIFELSLKFGGDDKLLEQVITIHNYVSTQAGGMAWLDKVISGVYTDDISKSSAMSFLFDMVAVRLNYCKKVLEKILKNLLVYPELTLAFEGYSEFFDSLKNIKDYDLFAKHIQPFVLAKKPTKNKKYESVDWDVLEIDYKDLKKQIEWLAKRFSKSLTSVQQVHQKTICDVKLLVELYKKTRQNYTLSKQKCGKYDFADFPGYVIQLLSNESIQKELSARYDYICVDEYQDTNYAQEEIYTKISNGENLFMVGDSKQSIYRFRLSEPKILLDKYNDYIENPEHGNTIRLDFNYRSDKGIVEFANAIFNEIMTKDFGGIDYFDTDQLQYGADYKVPPSNPSYEIHIFNEEKQKQEVQKTFDKVYSVRDDESGKSDISPSYKEGLFIAEKIKQIKKLYKIYDPAIQKTRKVEYSDIALLARTGKDNVRDIVRAIQDNQIPIDVAPLLKETGVYEVDIVKDILRLVANEKQDYPLAAALVSFWVGMDYDDLLDIRAKFADTEYFWQAVKLDKENEYIKKLNNFIDDLRLKSSYMSVKDLADYLVYDFGFDKYVLQCEGGEFKLSALKTYLATLSELSVDCSLQEYVSTLTDDKMEIKGGANGNMVRAMTIHKSKGLEFPVVFVCNIEDNLGRKNTPKLQINNDAGIAINYFDESAMVARRNLVFDILTEKNKLEDKAEAMRLFYVALTRPKNHIILTGCNKAKDLLPKSPFDVESFLDWIIVAASNNPKIESAITMHSDDLQKSANMQRYSFKKYQGKSIPIIDKYLNFEYPNKKAENLSIKYSVTEINKQSDIKAISLEEQPDDFEDEPYGRYEKAKRGTNYHSVLENIDLSATTQEKALAELAKMVEKGILTAEDVQDINVDEILSILNHPIMDIARKNKCYREQEFSLSVKACEVMDCDLEDEIFVQGAIDLLIVGEQVIVVDYKKSNEPEEMLVQRYKKQLQIYSLAVEKALGRKVDKAMLFIIGVGKVIEI